MGGRTLFTGDGVQGLIVLDYNLDASVFLTVLPCVIWEPWPYVAVSPNGKSHGRKALPFNKIIVNV